MRILLVDDDPQMTRIAALVLRRDGHQTRELADPHAVLPACRKELPDAILMDVEMDGMDGPDVLLLLRADAALASIPVVFLTGRDDQETVDRLLSLGAAGVIAKPIVPNTLNRKLAAILSVAQRETDDNGETHSVLLPGNRGRL